VESNNMPAVPTTDMTPDELARAAKYAEDGMPGLSAVSDTSVHKMVEMYMAGRSYNDISRNTGTKKDIVLFLSKKLGWYEAKSTHLAEVSKGIMQRATETKLHSAAFVADLLACWHKYMRSKIDNYLSTGNDKEAAEALGIPLNNYFKSVEALEKLMSEPPKSPTDKPPLVGVNVGDGMEIKKTGENSLEITPKKPKAFSNVLKEMADLKRQESADAAKARDINASKTTNPGVRKRKGTKQ